MTEPKGEAVLPPDVLYGEDGSPREVSADTVRPRRHDDDPGDVEHDDQPMPFATGPAPADPSINNGTGEDARGAGDDVPTSDSPLQSLRAETIIAFDIANELEALGATAEEFQQGPPASDAVFSSSLPSQTPNTSVTQSAPAVPSSSALAGGSSFAARHRRSTHRSRARGARMGRGALSQLTHRPGEHFTVLEQIGPVAPVLRDFKSAESLLAFLHGDAMPGYRAFCEFDDGSDEDAVELRRVRRAAGVGSVASSASSPACTPEGMSPQRTSVALGEGEGDDPGPAKLRSSALSGGGAGGSFRRRGESSSSSSSSSTDTSLVSGLLPAKVMWIDIQSADTEVIEKVLGLFPRIDHDMVDDLLEHQAVDTVHWFPSSRGCFGNVECVVATDVPPSPPPPGASSKGGGGSGHSRGFADSSFYAGDQGPSRPVIMSFVAFSDVLITVHDGPFSGHRAALFALYEASCRRAFAHPSGHQGVHPPLHRSTSGRRRAPPVSATDDVDERDVPNLPKQAYAAAARMGARGSSLPTIGSPKMATAAPVPPPRVDRRHRLTIGGILANVLESVVMAALPDPTACLAEVDRIDEMVLLVSRDRRDLLRRIARVRRSLSQHRASLYRKERMLQQILAPSLRGTFITTLSAEQYRHVLGEALHVGERLEAARDVLTQANSNFVSHISLQTEQASSEMNRKMKALSQVATVCLPLNIITGMFGMNVKVPFQSDENSSLAPFFVIGACMCVLVAIGVPILARMMAERRGAIAVANDLDDAVEAS